jgi:NAD(P) transhydrogenase subunit alpha
MEDTKHAFAADDISETATSEDPAIAAAYLAEKAAELSEKALTLSEKLLNHQKETTAEIIHNSVEAKPAAASSVHAGVDPLLYGITIFVLACFVGYYVVWKVTPALHTPLMSVTNAISGIIIVGAILAMGASAAGASIPLGFAGVLLASINIFGGFVVTHRMLQMFRKKKK